MTRLVGSPRDGCIKSGVRAAFYGCSRGDRIVKVALRDHDDRRPMAYPRFVDLDRCPACEQPHRAGLMWRTLKDDEELKAEVLI